MTPEEAKVLEETKNGIFLPVDDRPKEKILEALHKRGLVKITSDNTFDFTQCYDITSKGRLELNLFERTSTKPCCKFCGRTFEVKEHICAVCMAKLSRGARLTVKF